MAKPWVGTAKVLPGHICGHCEAKLNRSMLTLSCWQCQSILIYPEKKEKSMAKKQTVITEVYDTIWVGRGNLDELVDKLNKVNAKAFRDGERAWVPVGGPIVHSNSAEIMVVRRGELEY
jgi:hypothetical protein